MFRFLACALLVVSLPALAQVAGNPPAPATPASQQARAYAAIRTAWLVPPKDAQTVSGQPGMTLRKFAVLGMISHYSGKTIQQVLAQKQKRGTWSAVVRGLGGDLADLVFKGNARYPLTLSAGGADERGAGAAERRVGLLAQILTIERLTGDGPVAILQKLKEEQSFESLLAPARPLQRRPPAERRGRRRGGHRGPGGLGDRMGPPENHGNIGIGS